MKNNGLKRRLVAVERCPACVYKFCMNPIMLHFASGLSLFSGGILLIALVLCRSFLLKVPAWAVDVLALIGLGFVLLSGTPQSILIVGALLGTLAVWLVMIHLPVRFARPAKALGVAVVIGFVGLLIAEGRYAVASRVEAPPGRFYVIGDSLSAGIGGTRWPDVLRQQAGVEIDNLAVAGATASSAFSQVERVPSDGRLVVVEIGGNDLLGGNSAGEFAAALDKLLSRLQGHPIVMFELPLYPWAREFGIQQRRLAERHHVMLIPKRELAWVFEGPESTDDGLHLSSVGAQKMADVVAYVLRLGHSR